MLALKYSDNMKKKTSNEIQGHFEKAIELESYGHTKLAKCEF